ncbi:hypothetical protein ACEV6G_05910 [Enterobacter ludwigii]|uniref:hypothetical protein n=1 Tax=Enterobacter ludwigii TaxID=299767 RepID=UPI003BEEFC80
MKINSLMLLFLLSGSALANCDEHWETFSQTQFINKNIVQYKSFYYSAPSEKHKLPDLFLIKGDDFNSYLKSNGYTFGTYTRKNGTVVSGWLKSETLDVVPSKSSNSPPEVSRSDFVIISPYKNIELGSSYEQFYKIWGDCEVNKQPDIGISGDFITAGNETYKYFDNFWSGFSIRSSNINFQQTGTDYDAYRITTITVNNKKYMTRRGITIGDTTQNIIAAYGNPLKLDKNKVTYKFKNNELSFALKNDEIKSIVMDEKVE